MATSIVMPALGMAQETGTLIRWLKREGEVVIKGEPIMEIETDKTTVEVEATASGTLSQLTAREGDVVPVGQTIGWILGVGEVVPVPNAEKAAPTLNASPLARKIADEHGVDLSLVKTNGKRVKKDDVLAYLAQPSQPSTTVPIMARVPASPKARRLAAERGLDINPIKGSGPAGAVLAADIPEPVQATDEVRGVEPFNTTWRIMAERMTASWTGAPHFYLMREVKASALVELRTRITPAVQKRSGVPPTYTDLFVKILAIALRDHPRLNATWAAAGIRLNPDINIGLAVGIEDGLVVPVIHRADALSVGELALRRRDLVTQANEHRLRPADLTEGTFTLTNLGMYNVDAFLPILNPPQAAILALGRITDRVVPENGLPVVRPMVALTLACDHRVVDGVLAAKFLDDLVNLLEEPWGLLA